MRAPIYLHIYLDDSPGPFSFTWCILCSLALVYGIRKHTTRPTEIA